MAQSHQAPDDSTLRAHPRDSLMNTWIPALFGSAPSRLLKPPPRPKPLDYIYGLNVESTSEHTTTYTDPKDSKSTQSKTSGNTQAVQSSRRKSWRSLTSVTMRRLNMSRDSIPPAFAWKSPGEAAKDATIDEAKYKNQNPKHMDKVSNLDINDTILLTQTWEIQNTLQCTKRTVTNSPKQKQNSRNIPMSTQRLDKIRAWNVALERRHRLRRRIRRTARSLERYLKERGTPPKPTETACGPENSTVQSQPQELVDQSQCSPTDNSGGTTIQSKIPWPDRIAKICTRFMYFAGFSIILGSCVGIAIVIYFYFSRGTIGEILLSLLSLIMTNMRPMVKQYVDEIISSQHLFVQHSLVSEDTPVSEQSPVPEQPSVSGHTSASTDDKAGAGPWWWKGFLLAASIVTVSKTRGLNR
ncbi:hypothetical protein QBC45DRAFT_99675 [Copromyces sp. CBS 386.78]|nr:hypothetical protein QBC45DRAFT_99675 [Copromyces sp. CBS 386.78]